MIENKYKCCKNIWDQFNIVQKDLYNYMYGSTINDQSNFIHPNTKRLPKSEWETIVHNTACWAAWGISKITMDFKIEPN